MYKKLEKYKRSTANYSKIKSGTTLWECVDGVN
jgi:hypothetical protein